MGTLPDDFNVSLLSGCYLEMVCFGVRVTRFDFSRPQTFAGASPYKVSLCVEAGLKYQIDDIVGQREFNDSSTSAPLLDFLLMDVESVEKVETDALQIKFSTGAKITIESDVSDGYESYSIYLDSGDIIVV